MLRGTTRQNPKSPVPIPDPLRVVPSPILSPLHICHTVGRRRTPAALHICHTVGRRVTHLSHYTVSRTLRSDQSDEYFEDGYRHTSTTSIWCDKCVTLLPAVWEMCNVVGDRLLPTVSQMCNAVGDGLLSTVLQMGNAVGERPLPTVSQMCNALSILRQSPSMYDTA
jgi:hypothetical protein